MGRCNGFESVVCATESVLGNVRRSYRLSCGTGGKTSFFIIFCFARTRMSCKGRTANSCHFEHACFNPRSARFDSFAWPIIFWILVFKKWKYSFGTVGSPSCHQFLIVFVVFFHNEPYFSTSGLSQAAQRKKGIRQLKSQEQPLR